MTDEPKKADTQDQNQDQDEDVKTALYASDDSPIVLRPHVYDGIQEYDQRLPNWWLFTLYIMIVWFVVFWVAYYQLDWFKSDHDRITSTMNAVNEKKDAELQKLLADLDDRSLVADWATNEVALANAKETYTTHCLACHSADLSAITKIPGSDPIPMPGLPLTDGEWKYGEKPMDVFNIIHDGTPADSEGHNGARMEAWSAKLSPKAIAELTAYIISENKEEFAKYAQ